MPRRRNNSREDDDLDSDMFGDRDEGFNAGVFTCKANLRSNPNYIRVRAHRKKQREFNRLFLAQELKPKNDMTTKANLHIGSTNNYSTWCARFSLDGKYMASAGADSVIRIWQVLSTPEERESANMELFDEEEGGACFKGRRCRTQRNTGSSAPVFVPYPIREYRGHTGDILELSWSKNNFLLSSSVDNTVRLWHLDFPESISQFRHPDFVTSIAFHPTDDRFFLSGSLDCKLRLWSITEKEVSFFTRAPDLVMSVAFTPDGSTSICGCFGGQCLFYTTDGLTLEDQILVKSSHGKNSNGSKITGIDVIDMAQKDSGKSNIKLLISTNDSRIRTYDFASRTLEAKFKGHENSEGLICAKYSDGGRYIVSGSEDDRTYIWKVGNETGDISKTREDYEYFHSNKSAVTVALFAPNATRELLFKSRDSMYDVHVFRNFSAASVRNSSPSTIASSNGSSEESPGSRSRAAKASRTNIAANDGNIIIAFDQEGYIKVFRQDSAYAARKALIERKPSQGLSPQTSNHLLPSLSLRSLSPSLSRRLSNGSTHSLTGIEQPTRAMVRNGGLLSAPAQQSNLHDYDTVDNESIVLKVPSYTNLAVTPSH